MVLLLFQNGDKAISVTELEQIVHDRPDCFVAHFLLAKVQWHMDPSLQKQAFMLFLKVSLWLQKI